MNAAAEHGFQAAQRAFAAYIRHPDGSPLPPGTSERRMRVYARLFHNNVESFLAETFAVLRAITPDAAWRALVRDFLRRHRAASPYFAQMPEEFLAYLGNADDAKRPATPPFALELCHYEWLRLALKLAPDADCAFDEVPLAPDDTLALSPLAWPLRYAYPVERIGPDYQPNAPPAQPTHLIAWRDRHHRVRFMATSATTLRLVQLIGKAHTPGTCCAELARETGADVEALSRRGMAALNRLHEQDVVLRARPARKAHAPDAAHLAARGAADDRG